MKQIIITLFLFKLFNIFYPGIVEGNMYKDFQGCILVIIYSGEEAFLRYKIFMRNNTFEIMKKEKEGKVFLDDIMHKVLNLKSDRRKFTEKEKEIIKDIIGSKYKIFGNWKWEWNYEKNKIALPLIEKDGYIPSTLVIIDTKNREIIFEKSFKDKTCLIEDIGWSPSSKYISVLINCETKGYLPWEIILGLLGHPVSYNTFYLTLVNLENNGTTQLFIEKI